MITALRAQKTHMLQPEPTRKPFDVDLLSTALAGRLVGGRVLHYDTLGSTMDEARKLAEDGKPEGFVVAVEEQTAGRGRFSRAWTSPRSENISFSAVLRPSTSQMPALNMAATLAVCRVVEDFGASRPTIKWPNDVRVGGLKISGILIESAMDAREVAYAVVGIGVNVNLDPQRHQEIAETATSLFKETGRPHDRTRVLVRLLEHLDDLYARVKADEALTDEWAERLDTLGKTIQVRWGDTVIEGLAEGVDSMGNLILKLPDGSAFTASAGEVTLQV